MDYNEEVELAREIKEKRALWHKGWVSLGGWRYIAPTGTIHDLSAADLEQLERIEKEGLFLVDA
jgi:hypothetical protein